MQRLDKTTWDHAPRLPGHLGWKIMEDWTVDEGDCKRWVEVLFAGDSYVVAAVWNLGGVLAVRICGWWETEEQAKKAMDGAADAFLSLSGDRMRSPRCYLHYF